MPSVCHGRCIISTLSPLPVLSSLISTLRAVSLAMLQELLRADQHLKHMLKAALQHGGSGGEGSTAVRHSRSAKSRGHSKQGVSKVPNSHSSGDTTAAALASVLRRTAFRPLPPPMAPDNWETGGSTCYLQEQLQVCVFRAATPSVPQLLLVRRLRAVCCMPWKELRSALLCGPCRVVPTTVERVTPGRT